MTSSGAEPPGGPAPDSREMPGVALPVPRWVLTLIVVTAAVRVAFVLLFQDLAFAQPDATTYHRAAVAWSRHGLMSPEIPEIPYIQGGYPLLVSFLYRLVGEAPLAVTLVQALLSAAVIYFAWRVVARELGSALADVTAVLLILHPALWAMPANLLYETVFLFLLVTGMDLVSGASRAGGRRAVGWAAVAGLLLGVGTAIQSKMAAVALAAVGWLAYRTRRSVVVAVAVLSVLPAPLGYAARNQAVHGHAVLSGNLGIAMLIGANDEATGGYMTPDPEAQGCRTPEAMYARDRAFRSCALRWIAAHPHRLPDLLLRKTLYFFSPLMGPLHGGGVHMGPFDVRRWLPEDVRTDPLTPTVDRVLRSLWTLGFVALLGWGVWIAARIRPSGTLFLLAPTAMLLAVSLVTFGDSRYRIPAIPLYLPFLVLAAVRLYGKIRARGASRRR